MSYEPYALYYRSMPCTVLSFKEKLHRPKQRRHGWGELISGKSNYLKICVYNLVFIAQLPLWLNQWPRIRRNRPFSSSFPLTPAQAPHFMGNSTEWWCSGREGEAANLQLFVLTGIITHTLTWTYPSTSLQDVFNRKNWARNYETIRTYLVDLQSALNIRHWVEAQN